MNHDDDSDQNDGPILPDNIDDLPKSLEAAISQVGPTGEAANPNEAPPENSGGHPLPAAGSASSTRPDTGRSPNSENSAASEPSAKVGRPKGSRNKVNQAYIDQFLERYGSPLEGMGEILKMGIDPDNRNPKDPLGIKQMSSDLGIKPADALKAKLFVLDKVAPYVHQKMPTAIELDDQRPSITIIADHALAEFITGTEDDGDIIDLGSIEVIERDEGGRGDG